ncbi:uncharacterized protein LOC125475134 isoform X2 [Pyrus x bretschneideri]|uniref:uncharacterized protein LOC125475134 isoform X2 n=1 Tax=Pyrus x bretschneideri TaxID=225117 RepID=UPI00202FDBCB|nr:uncharacterized protein LOC125475134 isoform X2 [Pyrus x bretschneideri]
MAESDRDHSSEMEVRLDQKYHRWLSAQQICNVLRNPNYTISEKPATTPPSGSIVLYDRNLVKHFRKDGYKWKTAKDGRTKEGHEKLKVEGVDALHCYYAHREDGNFHRRSFWMIDQNFSHRVLVHYRDVKEDQIRIGKGVLPSSKIDASAYDHQASSGLPPVSGLQHDFACSSSNPSNFQHSQATDVTNLNSAQILEPENTVSAYNHRASYELPPILGSQHEIASSIPNPSNFQHSQATDATNLNSAQTLEPETTVSVNVAAYNHQASSGLPPILGLRPSNFQHSQATDAINFQDFDPSNCGGFENLFTGLPASNHQASLGVLYVPGYEIASSISNQSNFQHSQATDAINFQDYDNWLENLLNDSSDRGIPENSCTGLPNAACTNSRVSSSAAVEPSHSSLGKRQCDSTKSKATPFATIEGVDEDEEGNDTNQAWKRLKVTCGQKPPVPQPTATIGIATSAATNMTAALESSNPAMLQSRPTSDANQDFVQDVENQEKELEPTSTELENGKSKAVVQNYFGTGKSHEFSEVAVMDSCKSLHALYDRASATNTLASSSISTPTRDSQDIATIRTILEMDFTIMAGDVQRTEKISLIRSFVDSECSNIGIRTMILSILNLLEQPLRAYSEHDKGKNLNDQVEATIKRLEPKVQFWDSKKRELQELEKLKMQIEADLAAIRAEIDGSMKETEPIQAKLKELLRQRDQFKENEDYLKASLDIGEGIWTITKNVISGTTLFRV